MQKIFRIQKKYPHIQKLETTDYHSQADLLKGAVLTIGNFDGVHSGHRRLIEIVTQYARKNNKVSALYTFSPHPVQFLFPEKKHKLLCAPEKTREILQTTGLDYIIVESFTKTFSRLSPEAFMEKCIIAPIQPSLIVVGYNFRFGIKGAGSVSLLQTLAKKHNFSLKTVSSVKKKGVTVSSSYIKKAVLSGAWDMVFALLGRYFSITGLIVSGQGRGGKLGFPTINIKPDENVLLPVNGVYTVRIREKNQYFYGVMNIGTSPTFSKDCLKKIEIHIIGKNKGWDTKVFEVEILQYIRPEKQFSSASALVQQIKQDVAHARFYFQQIKKRK